MKEMTKRIGAFFESPKSARVILAASALLRLYYVFYISVYDMQHDAGLPYELNGHLGYITYLLTKGRLPDFDISDVYQFWHPPLHHALCALFLKVAWTLIPGLHGNLEPIQALPFLSVTVALYLLLRMLRLLLPGRIDAQNVTLAFAAFQPPFVHLSASVNNDAGALMMSFLALYTALLWYRRPKLFTIVLCALSFAAGLWIKASVLQTAVPVGILFLFRFLQESFQTKDGAWLFSAEGLRRGLRRFASQFAFFLVIAAPVGLYWYLRIYVLYRVPFAYAYYVEDMVGYLGEEPLMKRLFAFDPRNMSIRRSFLQFHDPVFYDVNPLIGLLKTAAGGVWSIYNRYALAGACVMLWLTAALFFVTAAGLFFYLKRGFLLRSAGTSDVQKNEAFADTGERAAIVLYFFAQLAAYYSFCFGCPCTWAMDYRYIATITLCAAVFQEAFLAGSARRKALVTALCLCYAAVSALYYLLLRLYTFV